MINNSPSASTNTPLHRTAGTIEVNRHALEIGGIAVGEHRQHPVDEVGPVGQVDGRIPAQAIGASGSFTVPGANNGAPA